MAGAKKTVANEETKEPKQASKTTKKVATGSTQKMVQKRSSSVAAKKTAVSKRENTKTVEGTKKKVAQKRAGTKEGAKKETTTKKSGNKSATKTGTAKKGTKSASTKAKQTESKIDVFEEETKEVFNSLLKVTGQDNITKKGSTKRDAKSKTKTSQEDSRSIKRDAKTKKEDKKLSLKEMAQIEETVKKEMRQNKKIPELELKRMTTRIFRNIFLAIVVMAYFNFIILGFVNIENSVFITDLKVFSGVILVITLGVMEYAFRKRSGRHAIHSIEFLVLSLITMGLIYINLTSAAKFIPVTVLITYVFAIYYMIKAVGIYRKMKKEYFMQNMKEIIRR